MRQQFLCSMHVDRSRDLRPAASLKKYKAVAIYFPVCLIQHLSCHCSKDIVWFSKKYISCYIMGILDNQHIGPFGNDSICRTVHRQIMILDRKSTRLNSSHVASSYAVFCLKKKR